MPRVKMVDQSEQDGGKYFSNQKGSINFINSGSALLNCVLGGGWPLTRIVNIVGDESTGKTLLVIEACANFHKQYPDGKIYYREAESAFDAEYARVLGMPVDAVSFSEPGSMETVEDLYNDLIAACDECIKDETPGLYALDSLDGLSDEEELKADFGKGTFGTKKAKDMSKMFRLIKQKVADANMCFIVISQTRDKINTLFPMKTRAGGKALDFYASIALWLSHADDVRRTINGVKRVTGIHIKAKCKKNKIALPYRQCEFTISFGHGIDSLALNIEWLEETKQLDVVVGCAKKTFNAKINSMSDQEYWEESKRVDEEVTRLWREVDQNFLEEVRPKYRDYVDE